MIGEVPFDDMAKAGRLLQIVLPCPVNVHACARLATVGKGGWYCIFRGFLAFARQP